MQERQQSKLDRPGEPQYFGKGVQKIGDRKQAEALLNVRERYLAALVEIQHQLLTLEVRSCYSSILKLLGITADASRVYIFENHRDTNGQLLMSQKAEWCAEGIVAEIDNPLLQNLAYDNFFPRWGKELAKGEIVAGRVDQFPDPEREVLEPQGILSILVLPLLVSEEFFGFIGFDNCTEARAWNKAEIDLLKVVAAAMSLSLERKQAESALEYRVKLEHLVTNISTQFINLNSNQIDRGVQAALGQVGKFAQVDRSYIFQLADDGTSMSNTYEWCAAGIEPQIERLQDISSKRFPWLVAKLQRFEAVCVPKVEALPSEASAEKAEFLAESIQSLLCIPMVSQGLLWGFIGLDSVGTARGWTEASVKLLKLIGEIFVSALERKRIEETLRQREQEFRALVENAPDIVLRIDREGRYHYINPTVERELGIRAVDFVGKTSREIGFSEELAAYWEAARRRVFETGQEVQIEFPLPTLKELAHYSVRMVPEMAENGSVKTALAIARNISDRKKVEETLLRIRKAVESASDAVGITDLTGKVIFVNPALVKLLGYTLEELNAAGGPAAIYEEPAVFQAIFAVLQSERSWRGEVVLKNRQGRLIPVEVRADVIRDPQGRSIGLIGTHTDISERKRTEAELEQYRHRLEERVRARTAALEMEIAERKRIEQQLFQEKELAQVTLHSIGDAAIATDAGGSIEYLNPVAEKLTGWQSESARGLPLDEVFKTADEATRKSADNPIQQAVREGSAISLANHTVLVNCNGSKHGIDGSASPIRDRNNRIIGAVLVFRDVTHSRKLAQKLSWQASHDALTGLVNRLKFEQLSIKALESVRHERQQHVLCYLDLDQFKVVNDTCGHLAGDELLKQVSTLLHSQIRATDALARLGGDEFGILLYQCSLHQAQSVANNLREAVYNFRFIWKNRAFSIGVSIGLVALDCNQSLVDVLSAADAACYAAKARGRNRVHVYQVNDTEVAKQRNERQWSVYIRQALKDDRFCLYQQAIVPIGESSPSGNHVEILLRMIGGKGELISPSAFIPAAERYGLMPEIDRWVICAFLAYFELVQSHETASFYSINLSGVSISDEQFLDWLKQKLSQSLASRAICFEITETAAISNITQASRLISELKQLGCRFALDDFGSGMSSFAYLKELPVDYLKIDGKFIQNLGEDPTVYAIVESINNIGRVIGIKTIAEYVNSSIIKQQLEKIGVNYVQGYEIAMPEPLTRLQVEGCI